MNKQAMLEKLYKQLRRAEDIGDMVRWNIIAQQIQRLEEE